MNPQKPDKTLIYIAYFPFATKRLLGEFDCERSPCTQRFPAQIPSQPNAFRRMPVSMKSRASWQLACGVFSRNSRVLYLHQAERVHSTFSPSNAVLVVANRTTELEGDDGSCQEED
jgi:hypothetical protein